MNRRNRIDIIFDILYASLEGASRTRIMYRANLNFGRFEKYFRELLDKGLIKQTDPTNINGCPVYKATGKARILLEQLDTVDQYIGLHARNVTRNRYSR